MWSVSLCLFDTHEYDVEFTSRLHEQYQGHMIAKNLYAQVNDEG
jgi:hypothetical protein